MLVYFETGNDAKTVYVVQYDWTSEHAAVSRFHCVLLVKFIKHNQSYYLKLDVSTSIRGLHQKKLVLSSSGSWHDGKTPCQESGRMRGSVCTVAALITAATDMACCPSFRMCMASLIYLVKRCGSLSITVAWDQLMTWFSWVAMDGYSGFLVYC